MPLDYASERLAAIAPCALAKRVMWRMTDSVKLATRRLVSGMCRGGLDPLVAQRNVHADVCQDGRAATWDGFAASKHLAALMTVKENA